MRPLLTFAAALVAGALVLGLDAGGVKAGPLPAMQSLSVDMTAVETVGWRRRYWRRYGVWPTGPRARYIIEDSADVVVAAPGETIVVSPVRPRSCGEYHYWNGEACVDARYNDPYLGPK